MSARGLHRIGEPRPAQRGVTRRLGVVVVVAVAAGLLAVGVLRVVQWHDVPDPRPRPVAVPARSAAIETLHAWDDARAAAWAKGDARALRRLYVAGSTAADADVRLLRRYVARGFVVRRLRTQLLDVRVVRASAQRLRLIVVDRFAGGLAMTGEREVRLPGGSATSRTLVLRRVAGSWLMASVLSASP